MKNCALNLVNEIILIYSVSQSVSQPASQSVNYLVSRSVNQLVSQSVSQPVAIRFRTTNISPFQVPLQATVTRSARYVAKSPLLISWGPKTPVNVTINNFACRVKCIVHFISTASFFARGCQRDEK